MLETALKLSYFYIMHSALFSDLKAKLGSGSILTNKGPYERLMELMLGGMQVYVVTRGMREIRAILIGRLGGFDRYWNLVSLLLVNRSF